MNVSVSSSAAATSIETTLVAMSATVGQATDWTQMAVAVMVRVQQKIVSRLACLVVILLFFVLILIL